MKIISGGQSGVDRAALDAALSLGFPIGGACPKGRRAEDGPIDPKYPLEETSSEGYPMRTRKNVEDSDGTLIIYATELSGGTVYTQKHAEFINKPHYVVDLDKPYDLEDLKAWIKKNSIEVLNVAGPRASKQPDIYDRTYAFMVSLFS